MTLEDKIAKRLEHEDDRALWQPSIFDLGRADDRRAVEALIDEGRIVAVCDVLRDQLDELVAGRDPSRKLRREELDDKVRDHLGGASPSTYGAWVFYPWSRRLVHVLPEPEFRELRHCRNRYKIKPEEQEIVATKTLGVVGLSVGQASAVTLAQEGIGRSFRLADFDHLSLSNMNRLRTSVASLGVSKVVIAAREMFEIDPYLSIKVWPRGLDEANVDEFLAGGGKLDLLVEECDDLFIKIFVRERAKALGIPTVMDTNERGMMDVERFDLEPDRPLLHGLLSGVRAHDVKHLKTRDKVPFMVRILGQDLFSPRFVPSLMEIDETIGSWPQLASGVALGAALVTDVARRLLLGQFRGSGRYFVDLDDLIREGEEVALTPPGPLDAPVSPLALEAPTLDLPAVEREITRDDVRRLVAHAIEAPSGGNVQPWRFVARGSRVRCLVDEASPLTLLDLDRSATFLAIGAAVENMDLAARASGLGCEVVPFPAPDDPRVVCDATFSLHGGGEVPALARYISQRGTNRKLGPRRPLAPDHRRALAGAAESGGGRLQVIEDPERLGEIASVLGGCDRVRFLSERLHAEMMSEVRWTPEEVERTRDGVDVATMELSRTDLAGMRLSRQWSSILFLREIGGGRALERSAKDSVGAASAVCLLTMKGVGPASYFRGGRALERVWLQATGLGLAVQPMTVSLYLWARIERGGGAGLGDVEIRLLREQRERFRRLFEVSPDDAEVMLFRVAHAAPPTARALRRHVDQVLAFEDE